MSPAPLRWSDVTALFGGVFDPPHVGHRQAVDGLFAEPGICSVRVIPSPTPPHKPITASADDRIAMARLGFAASAGHPLRGPVTIDDCEIRRASAHPGTFTYTFDTLNELRRTIPKVAFVVGTDQLEKLHTWYRFPEILGLSHWIVLHRKGSAEGKWRKVTHQWEASGILSAEAGGWRVRAGGTFMQAFDTPAPLLSSTQIRESLARSGNPPTGALLPEVCSYLMKHRLYGTTQSIPVNERSPQ